MTVAPPPPPGPGVLSPFPAPPTEGRRVRVGWGVGLGVVVLVLACGGGVAALVGLGAVMTRALNEQAQVVVGDYLDDIKARRYAEAYDALCPETRAQVTEAEFTSERAREEPIGDYSVGQLNLADVDLAV
ncbi:MAG TPA: hypothetical protein VFH03_11065, partial [Actinoplanes sp.]|nr:hypothetical protein [Actinoplanes sp.]